MVGPGTGGVDEDRRGEGRILGAHLPQAIGVAAQAQHMAVGAHFALVAADTAQVALMQGVGVDVTGGRVVDCPVDFFTAQDRQACTGFIDRQALHLLYGRLGAQVLAV